MLLIILVRGFCPLKIKILSPNFLVDSVLIHLIVASPPPSPPTVVIEMGVATHFSHVQNLIKSNNKIPHYARDYKKEYLFIRGLNKIEN